MNQEKQGYHRAKKMLPAIRQLITTEALSTDTKRVVLANQLFLKIKKHYKNQTPPTKETIIKYISKDRKTHRTQSPLNYPWHLGLLAKLPELGIPYMPADAVAAILKVQNWLFMHSKQPALDLLTATKEPKQTQIIGLTQFQTLTIRQAKWIAVLHQTTGQDTEYLWLASYYYSIQELVAEISRTPFDTTEIDTYLCRGKTSFYNAHKDLLPIRPLTLGLEMADLLTHHSLSEHIQQGDLT